MNSDISRARIARIHREMDAQGVRAMFIRDTSTIAWATAFDGVFDDEAAHALLITPTLCSLHTDSRYAAACRAAAQGGPVQVECDAKNHEAWLVGVFDAMHGAQPDADKITLGIQSSMMLGEYRLMQQEFGKVSRQPAICELAGFGTRVRQVKDADEVARLRAAQAITDAAFSHMVEFMRPGMTERAVQIELEDWMVRHGAAGLAFSSIVAAGANAAAPHAIPGDTVLEAGQCVVMDFGAKAQGYCSDMTRVVFVGAPDTRLRDAYSVLRQANEQVEAMLRPGVTGAQAHELAESVLADGGFGGAMGHALGHGVGIDIHESPNLSPRNDAQLCEGNVVTVEPGIYIEGDFGMRLEDFGVITEHGFDVFTQSTHDMVII